MLSRIAESLYWLGRYVERAEDTARILDVHYHLLLEDRWADEASACRALLEVMGLHQEAAAESDSGALTALLAFERAHDGSIVRSLESAWESARGAREAISSEMWECLNAAHEELPGRVTSAAGQMPHQFFRWVKERAAVLAGLSGSTMSRDDGWRFLLLGRSLERVDMTARLLSARYAGGWDEAAWMTTMRCCSAYEAYVRTYQHAVGTSSAAEFLLLDHLFPRSLYFSLDRADESLSALRPHQGGAGAEDPARLELGLARAQLELTPLPDLLRDLPARLTAIQHHCSATSAAIAQRYFRAASVMEWSA